MKIVLSHLSASQIQAIERRRRPGQASEVGFLDASQHLEEMIAEDRQTCRKLGVTPENIADRLEGIVGRAARMVELTHRGQNQLRSEEIDGFLSAGNPGITVSERSVSPIRYTWAYRPARLKILRGILVP